MRVDDGKGNKGVPDADTIALQAVVWVLSDGQRADRLLAMTGLDADTLRAGIEDRAILGALLDHLANHEPDLVACAQELGYSPAALIDARRSLAA